MFEKLYINIAVKYKLPSVNVQSEQHKLEQISPNGELERIIKSSEFIEAEPEIQLAPIQEEAPFEEEEEEETSEDDLADMAEDIGSQEEETAE